ncbi:hypothetical protein [Micromonospora chersina]|uniref:hypothetical protein n=1 Tax=Micromonospora chersina TaxID=47854 RepID=UPI00371657C0
MTGAATPSRFGEGPLSRAAALVHTLLVVELLLVLTTAPGLVALALLDRDVSNLPLVALCAVPLGPALSAAVYALHHQRPDLTDLHPARLWRPRCRPPTRRCWWRWPRCWRSRCYAAAIR